MDRYSRYSYPVDDDDAWNGPLSGYREEGGFSGRGPLPPPPPPGELPPPRRFGGSSAPRRRSHLAREIIETLVLMILIFVAIHYSVQTFRVDGPSMQPGLHTDEYVLVNKLAYLFHGPARGDVVVFHYPKDPNQDFIKRVIALPGDTIRWTADQIYVNGVLLKEPYISSPVNPGTSPAPITLQADQYFVVGDNRPFSFDSRSWGPVPKRYIIGKATVVFWPLGNWEVIPTYANVFASVPAPH